MVDGAMPKPLQDLLEGAMLAMVAGAMVVGWLNNRGRPRRGQDSSVDGASVDDGPHHHSWWDIGSGGDGHHGDGGDGGGDGGH